MTVNVSSLQDEFDADLARGYRGAKVDPLPNSAYSQESDPMTSPRAPRHGSNFLTIDEYADPDNPDIDTIYGRAGLDDAASDALNTQTITDTVPAHATAGTGATTPLDGAAEFDGSVTAATFNPTSTITGDADNNRIFTLRNATKDEDLASITTVATKTGGAAVAMTLDGSPDVSAGDEFEVVETVAGTGVAHAGATFVITVEAQA